MLSIRLRTLLLVSMMVLTLVAIVKTREEEEETQSFSFIVRGRHYRTVAPERATFAGREVIYKFPEPTRGRFPEGILFLFHGCNRRAASFFYSPEGMDIVMQALDDANMAVVAFSKTQDTGCWSPYDLQPTLNAAQEWYQQVLLPRCGGNATSCSTIPVFGLGASSGGNFVARMATALHDTPLAIRAMHVQIMAPAETIRIPTAFTCMSRDAGTLNKVEAIKSALYTQHIPTMLIKTLPKKVDLYFIASRYANPMNLTEAKDFLDDLQSIGAIDSQGNLLKNSRSFLEKMVASPLWMSKNMTTVVWPHLSAQERQDALELWIAEELNVAYDQHEITAEGFRRVLEFFQRVARKGNSS